MLKKEGYESMRAAFDVYNHLGYGMAEEVYQIGMIRQLTSAIMGIAAVLTILNFALLPRNHDRSIKRCTACLVATS